MNKNHKHWFVGGKGKDGGEDTWTLVQDRHWSVSAASDWRWASRHWSARETQTLVCADIGPWERGTSQAIGSVTAATDIGPRLQSRGVGARKGNE